MAKSIVHSVAQEGFELLKDTGKEAVVQLKEAGKDIITTAGVHTGDDESSGQNKEDISKLAKNEESFKGVEIEKTKRVLFQEQRSAEQRFAAQKNNEEILKRNEQARIEREKTQATKPLQMNPLNAISSKPKPGNLFGNSTERIKKTQ